MVAAGEQIAVLVVDDDEDDYFITRSHLDHQDRVNFRVEWCAKYDEALLVIAEQRHDVYLFDYRLGARTGLELIREGFASRPLAPVIVLTGQRDLRVDLEASELGATSFLLKQELTPVTLERSIRYAMRHHQALADLATSEERYALAASAVNDGIWDWDFHSDQIYFSPRWYEMFGLPVLTERQEPARWSGLVHDEDRDTLRAAIDDHLNGRTPLLETTHRLRHSDGSWRSILIRGMAVRDESGAVTRMAGSMSDVTDRLRSAQVEAQLAAIVRSSHDAIIGETLEGVITSWNPGAERLYGYSEAEVMGRDLRMLIPPECWEEELAVLDRILEGERLEQYETERFHKDGRTIAVATAASPIADSSGRTVGVARISRDVAYLQRAEAKFRGLLEAAPDAIVGVDNEGRIALVNAQTERLFGYNRDELIGQEVEILVPEATRRIHPSRRSAYFADPTPRPMGAGMSLAGRRKNGTEFPAEISLSAIETEEGLLVSAAIRDVTERVEAQAESERLMAQAERERMESRLQRSQRLESLGQLAGGVAHDFNNLLGAIRNFASFVGEEITTATEGSGQPDWPTALRDVAQIEQAADRGAQLTHQLLAFARREVVRPEVVVLNDVVTEVEQLLVRTLGEHVELVTALGDELSPVLADRGQLEQVLVNLAVNARDAMPGGGRLTIETENVMVDEAFALNMGGVTTGPHVRLRVTDTGEGMSQEVLRRAFEPFFTTKPTGEGTGLGLATVYGIVTQAAGSVRIHSEPGLGTSFSAVFPATSEAYSPTDKPAEQRVSGAGETVLVVEDEDSVREVATRILARNGYRVLAASSGPDALELVANHNGPIDLLLSDVIMPQMLGKEVAERVGAVRPGLRVLFMSGYASPVFGAEGTLEEGVNLLEKPFSESALLASVNAVLKDPAPVS
jgi:PAS domain S-box-containing protein